MATTPVEALLEERAGYERYGRTDRVAQVDAELARYNVAVDDAAAASDPELDALADLDPADLELLAELTDEQRAELAELAPPAAEDKPKPKRSRAKPAS